MDRTKTQLTERLSTGIEERLAARFDGAFARLLATLMESPQSRRSPDRPRSGRIKDAERRYGVGRTKWYEWAALYHGLMLKVGTASIIDYDVADQIIDQLPDAGIDPAYGRRRKQTP
jgi:hypothetical protein